MVDAIEIRIASLPNGHIRSSDFELAPVSLSSPSSSEVLIRNEWMSLDPYMRLGLTAQTGYVAPLQPGDVIGGPAIGVVEASDDAAFPIGARVVSTMGWRSHFLATAENAGLRLLGDDHGIPLEWHLGLLGLTGVTAWVGIERVLRPDAGEVIFISGAAGAVGSIACQLAQLRGARVLASAGSPNKSAWLREELGVDAVFNRHAQDLDSFLATNAPDGVDSYFDNVGGAMLEAFLGRMKPGGHIGLCGAIAQYEQMDYRVGPANFFAAIENELRLEGFNAFRLSPAEWAEIADRLKELALGGQIKACHTVTDGIHAVPQAFSRMFEDGQCGKLLVRL